MVRPPSWSGYRSRVADRRTPTSRSGLSRESALLGYDPRGDVLDMPAPPAPLGRSRAPTCASCAGSFRPPSRAARSTTGAARSVFDLVEPLLDFYYRHWFRVEVEGIENVPGGGWRPDRLEPLGGTAAGRADDHPGDQARAFGAAAVYMLGEHWFKGYPGVSM